MKEALISPGPNVNIMIYPIPKPKVDQVFIEAIAIVTNSKNCVVTIFKPGNVELKDPMKGVMAHLETKERVKGVHVLVGLLTETWSLFDFWGARGMRVKYWGTGHENWELTTYAIPAEYVAAVALEPGAVGVLKFLGDRKSTFEIAEDMKAVYGIKPKLERLGSLEDVYKQRNAGGQQDLQSEVTYFFLTGKIALGECLDNRRYSEIN
ncbi:hypothetical protein GTA08_BOTSDO05177 [Botryosphaeria dothidea]|uniref:NmrA-like domain-containing protein n=1 Tax=Botryosphaeria dothidea TaxID=55169 RepID=A0A8H4IWE3_9PEZI|nr:hypothetical protein GTA08_BOTSDO05177 [Botryosphaeria dothidea]